MNKTQATRPCMKNGVCSFNRNNMEVDRISSLPDEVLIHIFSFLSTKEAVQTCVLSKKWKNTWAVVPVLKIHIKEFQNNHSGSHSNESLRISAARFERFMTGFLDNRVPTNLDRVYCVCHFGLGQPDASMGWLGRVMLLMPQLINISITSGTGNSFDMPDLVFSCASLQHVSMSLSMSLYLEVKSIIRPVSINLPNLKFLELTFVKLHDDFPQKLFVGCPSLERLKLCRCHLYFSGISSEVLKELTLYDCRLHEQMQISCPNLVSLSMRIILLRDGISLKNMSSLENVGIKLYQYPCHDVPILNLFGGLSNAAKLELYLGARVLKEQLEKDIPNCRNFNNLKKLVVGAWDMSYDFSLIACLLKHSPNLKELDLLLDESRGQIQEPIQDVPDVLFQYEYLETVKIYDGYGRKLSSQLINAMIKILDRYVKKIGNMIIAYYLS